MTALTRRRFLQLATGVPLCLAGASAFSQTNRAPRKVDVVKILSFACPTCRASEAQDRYIESRLETVGGRLLWAPVPTIAGNTGERERVYYAARAEGRVIESRVRASLYKAVQDMGLSLPDLTSVYTWLQSDLPDLEGKLDSLFDRAASNESKNALARALRLGMTAGISSLPSYLLVANSTVLTLVDPSSATNGNILALRDSVVSAIEQHSGTQKP